MRKMLLLLLTFITSCLFAGAQKSVLVSDSTYFYDYLNSKLRLDHWDKHFYNSNCLDSVWQWQYSSNSSVTNQRLSDYYPNGNLYHQITQTTDTAAHAYVNQSRAT